MLRSVLVLLLACGTASAAPAPKLPSFDFEGGVQGWEAPGGVGVVANTAAPEGSRLGKSVLEHRFRVEQGQAPVLMVALPGGLAGMASLTFDVATGTQTIVSVALTEEKGARYEYLFATPDQAWTHVAIDASEFRLADDTKDANNRLDLAEVRSLVIADIRSVITAISVPMTRIFGERKGDQAVWLDNVVASAEPALPKPPAGTLLADDFTRENMAWVPLGGMAVALAPAPNDAKGRAVRAVYTPAVGNLTALMRPAAPGVLSGAQSLALQVGSKVDAMFALAVEEVGGARYAASFSVKGGETLQPVTLALAAFQPAPGSKDDNGKLDMDRVKSLAIIDLAAFTGERAGQANTLWLRSLTVAGPPPAAKP